MLSLTCLESIVRVAGATFTETGIQSFLSLSLTAASSVSLITSIPEKRNSHMIQYISLNIENPSHDQDTKSTVNSVYINHYRL